MPRRVDVRKIQDDATIDLNVACARFGRLEKLQDDNGLDWLDLRWSASMTLVEFHAIWERFAEARLVAALNAFPQVFIAENAVRGMTSIPAGLAVVLVRGGKYFDFRSCEELIWKGKRLVGAPKNPFRGLPREIRDHLDTMAAIRNWVVHRSEAAKDAYKRRLCEVFGITSAPDADEFLNAIDRRRASPAKGLKRLLVIERVIRQTVSWEPTPE